MGMSEKQIIDPVDAAARAGATPVVHLELHTRELSHARDFYGELLGWRAAPIDTDHGCYLALGVGGEITGGVVECATERPLWLPYVEVDRVDVVTGRARALGASVLLGPREGPAGWRSVISAPGAGQLALWQPKEWR
jgi:predicted enzyme related to lactoylglutathione lyase